MNFDQPPAKLLTQLYRSRLNRPYRKVIDGANLFQSLEPDNARKRCPYLSLLLEDMLSLVLETAPG